MYSKMCQPMYICVCIQTNKKTESKHSTALVPCGALEIANAIPVIPSYPLGTPDCPISATKVAFMFVTSKVSWG